MALAGTLRKLPEGEVVVRSGFRGFEPFVIALAVLF
jgi:hypothetical protein